MCTQYPEIIITSPKEPAAFCYVPQTIQENLLTTNYEQWCALYSMNDDDISLAYVSSNLQKQREQQIQEEYEYGEEYRYEYNDFEDDDFFDKYQQPLRRQTLDDEFNSYNETHIQKFEGYDNKEFEYYDDYDEEDEDGFDYEYDYEYDDESYNDEGVFYMEKEPSRPAINRPRLNYDILASAISRRFNNTTDSDVSEEEDSVVDEFDNETFEAKVVVKSTQSIKTSTSSVKNITNSHLSRHDLFQEESFQSREEDNEMHNFMETIKNKFSNKEISSSLPTKSGFSIMNDLYNNDHSFGIPEAMSNRHGARNTIFTHRKSSSLQSSLFDKTLNFPSMIMKDSGVILSGPMKNRKRAFSLNEQNRVYSNKYSMNNKSEFSDLKNVLFCF
ncbi:hypothetical protein BCR36DRAFT_583731 [Piromyces finnis]|uniref:Uncharacterized protein n=1 Tax=Piromyces finnis TaxID=1754191 RepID=A0A1Y1V909_9FUNG|nr:hypothetical protein BCR36DRAFT_583731 [Piromyces finnis]|eukprot:ORX49663.1 hypothetical protein BCR36DRAFT_583731 [Piromyces finnis]